MVIASLLEVVSVGLVIPFLGVITAPEQIYSHSFMESVVRFLEFDDPNQLVLPLTVLLVVAVLIASSVRLILLYAVTKFSFSTGADLSVDIYRRTLYQEYLVHIERNTSEIINGIISKSNVVVNGVVIPVLTVISTTILMVAILSLLFIVEVKLTLISLTVFVGVYWGVIRFTRKKLNANSECIAERSTLVIKSLQEGLGGIRDVLIDRTQEYYCQAYRKSDLLMRNAMGSNQFISGSPRFVMDAMGMILIAGMAYFMTRIEGGNATIIPTLGVIALGAQRMLPALQQGYAAYSTIKGVKSSFGDVLHLLGQQLPAHVSKPQPIPLPFENKIQLRDICFRYSKDEPWILKNISLDIKKGSRIGFVGETGSGKSTLLDIIMGLLPPTSGKILIDGQTVNTENIVGWRDHISHVPQNIYLSDGTLIENIALGIPDSEIDYKSVIDSVEQAQLTQLIDGWRDGYNTIVGEHGVKLSGGQRQRIGVARALYRDSSVLIFDEATSALDNKTERALMEAIESMDRNITLLIIAHRITTLKGCDEIIMLDGECGIQTKNYQDLCRT